MIKQNQMQQRIRNNRSFSFFKGIINLILKALNQIVRGLWILPVHNFETKHGLVGHDHDRKISVDDIYIYIFLFEYHR